MTQSSNTIHAPPDAALRQICKGQTFRKIYHPTAVSATASSDLPLGRPLRPAFQFFSDNFANKNLDYKGNPLRTGLFRNATLMANQEGCCCTHC